MFTYENALISKQSLTTTSKENIRKSVWRICLLISRLKGLRDGGRAAFQMVQSLNQ